MGNTADSSKHPFRDGRAGAEAKRLKLLRDCRDELATMSHEIRQVYVRRFSRLLASIALCVGGGVIVAASFDSELADSLASLLPGQNPAALSTLLLGTWLLAAFALFSGRAWAERRFSIAMSKAVLPTDEVHTDVSRLACEAPAAVGRNITRRLVPISRMLNVLASGLIVPVSVLAGLLVVRAGGYPRVDDVESLFAQQAGNLLLIATMALVFSLRLAASPNWRPSFATAVGLAMLVPGVFVVAPGFTPALLAGGLLLSATAFLNYRRRVKENSRIEQEGTPMPPVINFRKRCRQLWEGLCALPNIFRWSTWQAVGRRAQSAGRAVLAFRPTTAQTLSTAVLLAASLGMALAYSSTSAQAGEARLVAFTAIDDADGATSGDARDYSTMKFRDDGQLGRALVDFHFGLGATVDATEHLQNAYIPPGWHATITIDRLQADGRLQVQALDPIVAGPATRQISDSTSSVVFEYLNCSGLEVPLQLVATPYGKWPEGKGTASLRYGVKLAMISGCNF